MSMNSTTPRRYSEMEHLASVFFGDAPPQDCFMNLYSAFYDAAGQETQLELHVVACAGVVATADKWKKFEAEWRAILAHFGVSEFHGKDYANSAGQFKHWRADDARRPEFERALVAAYKRGTNKTFVYGMVLADYLRITQTYRLADGTDGAYAFGMLACAISVE